MPTQTTNAYIDMMKYQGWKVYIRGNGQYAYVTDGTNIAYVQWSDRIYVATVHKPNTLTGTGFHYSETINPTTIREAMRTRTPFWASSTDDIKSVRKYKNWDEFHNSNSFNKELVEA